MPPSEPGHTGRSLLVLVTAYFGLYVYVHGPWWFSGRRVAMSTTLTIRDETTFGLGSDDKEFALDDPTERITGSRLRPRMRRP